MLPSGMDPTRQQGTEHITETHCSSQTQAESITAHVLSQHPVYLRQAGIILDFNQKVNSVEPQLDEAFAMTLISPNCWYE